MLTDALDALDAATKALDDYGRLRPRTARHLDLIEAERAAEREVVAQARLVARAADAGVALALEVDALLQRVIDAPLEGLRTAALIEALALARGHYRFEAATDAQRDVLLGRVAATPAPGLHRCAGMYCPGLEYRASDLAHPASCVTGVAS